MIKWPYNSVSKLMTAMNGLMTLKPMWNYRDDTSEIET